MMDLVRWISVLVLAVLVYSQEEAETGQQAVRKIYRQESQQIKLQQKIRKNEVNIEKTNFKSYNFKLNQSSEFILWPEENQEIKAVFDAYWKQNNVYMQAAVLKGEEITVSIENEVGRKIIDNEIFYSSTGVTFQASGGVSYRLTARESGKYQKIVMMRLSETVIPSNKTAKRDEMAKVHSKLLIAKIKLENSLNSAQRELMVENKLSQQILRQSENYSSFEIFEAFFIAFSAFLEVRLVINLLKTDSII